MDFIDKILNKVRKIVSSELPIVWKSVLEASLHQGVIESLVDNKRLKISIMESRLERYCFKISIETA